MNSFQILSNETHAAIEEQDETKLQDIVRRIKNLMVTPTCKGYPWKDLIEKIKPSLKEIDRENTLQAILELRRREADQTVVNRIAEEAQIPVTELEDLSDDFLTSWSNASNRSKKERRRHG